MLLDSYSQERTTLIGHQVQPITDLAERFQTARPHRRVALVRALDTLFGFGQSAGTLTRKFSMLDVTYKHSQLLDGRSTGLGRRLPDALTEDGQRITPKSLAARFYAPETRPTPGP